MVDDGRADDDGPWLYYKLTNEPKGSSELITELSSCSYFSTVNVHLVDIYVFTKFDEIPSLPVKVIKKKTKMSLIKNYKGQYEQMNKWMDGHTHARQD